MRSSSEREFLYRRLDEIRMSEGERMRARAHLERAEAFADLIATGSHAISRLFRSLVLRPLRRFAAAVG